MNQTDLILAVFPSTFTWFPPKYQPDSQSSPLREQSSLQFGDEDLNGASLFSPRVLDHASTAAEDHPLHPHAGPSIQAFRHPSSERASLQIRFPISILIPFRCTGAQLANLAATPSCSITLSNHFASRFSLVMWDDIPTTLFSDWWALSTIINRDTIARRNWCFSKASVSSLSGAS